MEKEKACKTCMKVKNLEEYSRASKNKDGRKNQCKACDAAYFQDQQNKKRQADKQKKMRPPEPRKASVPIFPASAKSSETVLMIDFSRYPEVLKILREHAFVNIRSVEEQALYYIVKELKKAQDHPHDHGDPQRTSNQTQQIPEMGVC